MSAADPGSGSGSESGRRGQILLIGAVVFGAAIIGSVVILNDLQVTDSRSANGPPDEIAEAEETRRAVVTNVEGVVERVDRSDPSDFEGALDRNLTTLERTWNNMSLSGGKAYVAIEHNGTASTATQAVVDIAYRSASLGFNTSVTVEVDTS